MCIIQCANIIGNALSAALIRPLGQKAYSFVMLSLNILISLLYLLTKEFPEETAAAASSEEQKQSLVS